MASTSQSQRRRRSPPPLDLIQRNIASSIAKVVTRMVEPELQQKCMDIMQIQNVAEAEGKILQKLQKIDAEKAKKSKATTARKSARGNAKK